MDNTVVFLSDFLPLDFNERQDIQHYLNQAISKCPSQDAVLHLSKGIYHIYDEYEHEKFYYISNNDRGIKLIAFPLIHFNNLTIEGNDSELIFHGRILPFVIEDSKNIVVKNLTIDYEIPFFAQGVVLESNNKRLVLKIDNKKHPYYIWHEHIYFYGENWESCKIDNFLEFDPLTKAPAYCAGDDWISFRNVRVKEISSGIIEFSGNFHQHQVGNIIVISFEKRNCPGFFLKNATSVLIENVTFYHTNAMGVIAQTSKDICLRGIHVSIRSGCDRILTCGADATHFVNCSGKVIIEDCVFENQKDDALNCHGIYTTVKKILSPNSVLLEYHHQQQIGIDIYFPGDLVTFVDKNTLKGIVRMRVASSKRLNAKYLCLTLTDCISNEVQIGDVVENYDRMPEVTIKNCRIGNNRARGILLSSCKRTIVTENQFYTAGSAVLISGDASDWFESGSVNGVLIENNEFRDCNYSVWGSALIDIAPNLKDLSVVDYHCNIQIKNNTILSSEEKMLYARHTTGIVWKNNSVHCQNTYKPHLGKEKFDIKYCQDIVLEEN